MAGNQNSGGFRPSAPQNNPANISATGGNGQSGRATQPAQYISGMPYGQGQATMQQQKGAPMAASYVPPTGGMQNVVPLTEPSQRPNEPVTQGSPLGAGAGPEAIVQPPQPPSDPDMQMIKDYFPAMELWASQPDSSQGTKDYVNYLRTIL
jgi:hypothetical protein